ncbi:MAG: hypothetical protein U9P14_10775, partial [Gemmatimonadota bacterium]|nr:hypothetical protein [Gemmatimonadota bacterium]
AFELADIVCPISVRPGGRLDLLSAEFSNSGKEFHDDFRVKWSRVSWSPKYRFPMDEINPELRVFEQGWLTHWTHTWPGPWPSEQAWEFYRDMLAEPETYVRDARATLSRIISEGLLRASSWKMPAEEPAVGFTALAPAEALGLMRWRKRYTRYSFEPFGLALRLEPLERLGARPVRYLKPDETARLGTGKIDKLFTQSAGRKGNWAAEREWRCRGDLPLGSFTKEELVLFAADSETAETIKAGLKQAWEVIPLFI